MATVYKQQLWQESVSATTATPSVTLGTRRIVAAKEYVYAYNAASAADQGCIVRPQENNDSGYSFTVTTVAGSLQPVMGAVSEATAASGDYCWVQTKGKARLMQEGAVTGSVIASLDVVPIIQGGDGSIDAPTGGTGTTGRIIGYYTTAASDNTGLSVGCYIHTGY